MSTAMRTPIRITLTFRQIEELERLLVTARQNIDPSNPLKSTHIKGRISKAIAKLTKLRVENAGCYPDWRHR